MDENITCHKCKTQKLSSEFYCNSKSKTLHARWCKTCCKEWTRARYTSSKGELLRERNAAAARRRYAENLEESRAKSREAYHRQEKYRLGRLRDRKVRAEVLAYYGNACTCCGEGIPQFLCIDHINGNGNNHRKTLKTNIYYWLRRNGYPSGFQVLCHNCNMAKGFYGQCPHEAIRIESQASSAVA
jgi:hypothetical protein